MLTSEGMPRSLMLFSSSEPNYARFVPHLEQKAPDSFLFPQLVQNQAAGASGSGFFFPQAGQKLPVDLAPHSHVQPLSSSGFFFPQLEQKFPVLPLLPQEHSHPDAAFAFAAASF